MFSKQKQPFTYPLSTFVCMLYISYICVKIKCSCALVELIPKKTALGGPFYSVIYKHTTAVKKSHSRPFISLSVKRLYSARCHYMEVKKTPFQRARKGKKRPVVIAGLSSYLILDSFFLKIYIC